MTDEGTNSNQTNFLEQIAREERLLQEYEHELQQLQTVSKSYPPEESDLLIDDSLQTLLESVSNVAINSSLLQALEQEPPHNIQPAIRGFCFTNAVRQSRDTHVLKGHFMANTSVEATIQIQIRRSGDCNTIAVKCFLDHNDHAWMSQHVSDDDLPFWIDGISNYLEFDKKRTQFLENNFEFERKESCVRIQLSDFLIVYWDWKWKRGEDALRLPTSVPLSTIIQPRNLEALVQVCKGNCLEVLNLLRETLTNTDHQNIDSGEDSDESDSSPVGAKKHRYLNTPPSQIHMKKRKHKRGYTDDNGYGEDSSESDSLPVSFSKHSMLKTPPSQTGSVKRRQNEYLDDIGSGEDLSERDSLPVSPSKCRLLKTQPSQTKAKRRKTEYSDDVGSGDDSSESDLLLVSSSKHRVVKMPPSQTKVKKQRRKSGYLDIVMAKRKKR